MINVNFGSLDEMLQFANRLAGLGQAGPAPKQESPTPVTPALQAPTQQIPVQQAPPVQEKELADPEPDAIPDSSNEEEKKYTLEEVRAKLAALNKAGKRAEVKEILGSFGVEKLSEIPEDKYQEVMEMAGEA